MSKLMKFGVVTVSDTCSKDESKDRSGPRLCQLIKDAYQNVEIISKIVPDSYRRIQEELRALIEGAHVNVIFTAGGTGFAPRDITPEATLPLLEKQCRQLEMAMALDSLQKTKFAALTRGVCGICKQTLIINLPGSEKAVTECFEVVRDLLPHAMSLIANDLPLVRRVHAELQAGTPNGAPSASIAHVCPHATGAGDDNDRNSPYPMLSVEHTLQLIYSTVQVNNAVTTQLRQAKASVHIPPFRASIKDGYAMKSSGFSGTKRVIGCISAGSQPNNYALNEDECFKINTGAPVPEHADSIVQVEDTKLLKRNKNSDEELVDILVDPKPDQDIRPIGHDLLQHSNLFPSVDHSPVVIRSLYASVGEVMHLRRPKIAVLSTGSELLAPHEPSAPGKIYDSNSSMLDELLCYFNFECMRKEVITDDYAEVLEVFGDLLNVVDFVICTGGVSMGDKDHVKAVLAELNFTLHVGRVNMKPGKPMTFASRGDTYFFGLPGNPVSAFVTFHLFALPAIRWAAGWPREKCNLPKVSVRLQNDEIQLDPRPEYVRATLTSRKGVLYASVTGDQISSRLQSIVGADALVQLPARTAARTRAQAGELLYAYIIRYDFITHYE